MRGTQPSSSSSGRPPPTGNRPLLQVAGLSSSAVTEVLTGLMSGTTYHYRVVAISADVAADGADETFTTTTAPGGNLPAALSDLKLAPALLTGRYQLAAIPRAHITTGRTIATLFRVVSAAVRYVSRPNDGSHSRARPMGRSKQQPRPHDASRRQAATNAGPPLFRHSRGFGGHAGDVASVSLPFCMPTQEPRIRRLAVDRSSQATLASDDHLRWLPLVR